MFEPQFCNNVRDGRRQQFAYMPRCLRRTQRDVAGPPARCIAAYRASLFQHRYIWLQLVIYSNLPPAALPQPCRASSQLPPRLNQLAPQDKKRQLCLCGGYHVPRRRSSPTAQYSHS